MRDTSNHLKEVDSLIALYESTVNDQKKQFAEDLKSVGLTYDLAEGLSWRDNYFITNMQLDDINTLLKNTDCDTNALMQEYYHLNDKSITYLEFCTASLLKIKEKMISIIDAEESIEELKQNRLDLTRSFVDALKSPEYREARLNHLRILKEMSENEEDPKKKKEIQTRLYHIERSQNFSFLNERLHKIGKKEIRSIKDAYFDNTKGVYVMQKYYNRLERLNINRALHGSFFNLEEKFLPEEYSVFNNFFLFHVIRWVSYMDPNIEHEYLYMSSLIGALRDLVTEEATDEEKNTLISVMKDFYSFFNDDYTKEYFNKYNANHKNHPERIAAEKRALEQRELKAKEMIKTELGELYDTYESSGVLNAEELLKDIQNKKAFMLNVLAEMGVGTSAKRYEDIYHIYNNRLEERNSSSDESKTRADEVSTNNGLPVATSGYVHVENSDSGEVESHTEVTVNE